MTNLAIIPARGGSTRLKNKNILPLGGKPLICHTVEAVIESGLFDTILVATDSKAIAQVVYGYPEVGIRWRDSRYADARSTVLDALLAMLPDLDRHDTFSYFLPTCPFRTSDDIMGGMSLLTETVTSVVSVCEYEFPIQLAVRMSPCYDILPVQYHLVEGDTNSKYLKKHYHPNGGFYITRWDSLVRCGGFFKGIVKGYIMTKEHSLDINDAFDLEVAECLISKGQYSQ